MSMSTAMAKCDTSPAPYVTEKKKAALWDDGRAGAGRLAMQMEGWPKGPRATHLCNVRPEQRQQAPLLHVKHE